MNNFDYQDVLFRYLQGKACYEEKAALFAWIEECDEHKQEFLALKELWTTCEVATAPVSPQKVLRKEFGTMWKQVLKKQGRSTIIPFVSRELLKIAGVALLALALGFFARDLLRTGDEIKMAMTSAPENYTIEVDNQNQPSVTLPDGTVVWLNARTKLNYPLQFSGAAREVWLEGEAFFDVVKDAGHPFIVHTEQFDMVVRGTSFNISSYNNDEEFQAILVEGELEVKAKNPAKEQPASMDLSPGEMMVFSKETKKVELKKDVNVALYTSWKDGVFRFKELKFDEIAKQLERRFNVSFVYTENAIKHKAYTGTFYNYQSLQETLEIINQSTPFRYTIEENTVIIY